MTEEKLARIGSDPLPDGLYAPDEAAIVRYVQASSRLEPITDELYAALLEHFTERQIIEICFTVGMSNMINRFHASCTPTWTPRPRNCSEPSARSRCPRPGRVDHGPARPGAIASGWTPLTRPG